MKPKNEASNLKPLSPKPGFLSLVNKGLAFPFIGLIFLYKKAFSPLFPASCRFTPSCSEYALQAFKKYGFLKGFRLTAWRIMRCQPFHPGGRDPLP